MALLTATKDNFEEMIAQENAVVEFWDHGVDIVNALDQ